MNKFVRIIMVIVSLGLLAGLVMILSVFVDIPAITNFTRNAVDNYSWIPTLLAVVVIVFIVLTLVSILTDFFLPSGKEKFVAERDMGHIEISDKSIESVANMAASEVPGVRRYTSKVKGQPHPGRVKLEMFAETDNSTGLASTGKELQEHVAQRLAETLDIQPHDIHVKLQPYAAAQGARGTSAPRVM